MAEAQFAVGCALSTVQSLTSGPFYGDRFVEVPRLLVLASVSTKLHQLIPGSTATPLSILTEGTELRSVSYFTCMWNGITAAGSPDSRTQQGHPTFITDTVPCNEPPQDRSAHKDLRVQSSNLHQPLIQM